MDSQWLEYPTDRRREPNSWPANPTCSVASSPRKDKLTKDVHGRRPEQRKVHVKQYGPPLLRRMEPSRPQRYIEDGKEGKPAREENIGNSPHSNCRLDSELFRLVLSFKCQNCSSNLKTPQTRARNAALWLLMSKATACKEKKPQIHRMSW